MPKIAVVLVPVAAIVVVGSALVIPRLGQERSSAAADLEERFARLERSLDERVRRLESRLRVSAQARSQAAPRQEEKVADGEEDTLGPLQERVESLADRLQALETQMAGLAQDPVDRGFSYLSSTNAGIRRRGIGMLERLARSDPRARAAIRGLLADPDSKVREEALEAIRRIKDLEALPQVLALMDDPEPGVRGQAAGALDRLLKEAAPESSEAATGASALTAHLGDNDSRVRRSAADALAKIRSPQATQALIGALKDPVDDVRREAISSLGQAGDPAAVPHLRALYDQGSPKHGVDLALSLMRLGDAEPARKEAARLSQIVTTSQDERERSRAVEMLGKLAPPEYREVVTRALEDPSSRVRREAERALREIDSRRQ